MIRNFSDHAANERTFLSWVRTAIAVMAFGFLVERFDLFLLMTRGSTHTPAPHIPEVRFGEIAGLGLMATGLAIVAVATLRFVTATREIDDEAPHAGPGSRFDLALAALLFFLGCGLVAYLVSNLAGYL